MEKKNHLINIYLKIHNKRPITMDDLRYLAQYDPECFEKTCKNVVYNLPESKPIMEPTPAAYVPTLPQTEPSETFNILAVLDNIKQLESDAYCFASVDVEQVKNLLGNLYMELLFPHNDKDTFIHSVDSVASSRFDQKA